MLPTATKFTIVLPTIFLTVRPMANHGKTMVNRIFFWPLEVKKRFQPPMTSWWPRAFQPILMCNTGMPFKYIKRSILKKLYFEWPPPWHCLVIASRISFGSTYFLYIHVYIWHIFSDFLFWHSIWHIYIYYYYYMYIFWCHILAFYLASILTSYLALLLASILTFSLAFYPVFFLIIYLAFNLTFYSGILFGIYSDVIAFYLVFMLAFFPAFILAFILAFHLHSILAFYLASILTFSPTWVPPDLSGRAHWDLVLAVVVRQCPRRFGARGLSHI